MNDLTHLLESSMINTASNNTTASLNTNITNTKTDTPNNSIHEATASNTELSSSSASSSFGASVKLIEQEEGVEVEQQVGEVQDDVAKMFGADFHNTDWSRSNDTTSELFTNKPACSSIILNENENEETMRLITETSPSHLKIKTKSIETTLLPLVNQITTLVQFRENFNNRASQRGSSARSTFAFVSDRATNALLRVGESLHLAVDRFVNVGETIAYENATIKADMLVACKEARQAGLEIRECTRRPNSVANIIGLMPNNSMQLLTNQDNLNMIQAADKLLTHVTHILLLADVVIINQILASKNKVLGILSKLENVLDVNTFMSLFKQYGIELVELAYLSGERQNDLKDDKRRSQLSSSRWILEKSTLMILTTSKAYLKHIDCECAQENVNQLFSFLQNALDSLHHVIVDSGSLFDFSSSAYAKSSIVQISFTTAYKQLENALELVQNNMLVDSTDTLILNALNSLIDSTQDFTDSLYICNDQRERILRLQNEIRDQILNYLKDSKNNFLHRTYKLSPILNDCDVLKRLLQSQTMQLTNNLFRENQDALLLSSIKSHCVTNDYDQLVSTLDKFKEYSDHVLELCKLLRHISVLDVFEVTCEHHYNVFDNLSKMIQSAAGTAALFSECKSANDNLDLYCNNWESQVNDLSILVKEMQEYLNGDKSTKSIYLSLPRPGKQDSNTRLYSAAKSTKLDTMEKAKVAKLGLEMKLITSEMEAEAEKWNMPENEVIRIGKLMSTIAYNIHLFTRGEGSLHTTHDLFRKAEQFLQLGVLFYNTMRDFIDQVPDASQRNELAYLVDKLPNNFQSLKSRLKQVTVGKSATFNKVDWVIQETRDFMSVVSKLVNQTFKCSSKYKINYDQLNSNNANRLNDATSSLLMKPGASQSNQTSYYMDMESMNTSNSNATNTPVSQTKRVHYDHMFNDSQDLNSTIEALNYTCLSDNQANSNRAMSFNFNLIRSNRSDSCGPSFVRK